MTDQRRDKVRNEHDWQYQHCTQLSNGQKQPNVSRFFCFMYYNIWLKCKLKPIRVKQQWPFAINLFLYPLGSCKRVTMSKIVENVGRLQYKHNMLHVISIGCSCGNEAKRTPQAICPLSMVTNDGIKYATNCISSFLQLYHGLLNILTKQVKNKPCCSLTTQHHAVSSPFCVIFHIKG